MNIEEKNAADLEVLLEESVRIHGHLCAGQVLGVRMSMLGLNEIGIRDPKGRDRKSIIVFVEMDRCATDATQSATGCSLGKRSIRFLDYGKMAATFLNITTGRAMRIIAREDSRQKAKEHFPEIADKYADLPAEEWQRNHLLAWRSGIVRAAVARQSAQAVLQSRQD